MTTLTIAAAQIPVGCDPEANGTVIRETMAAAKAAGARLVQFPEGAISGYPGDRAAKRSLSGWNVDWGAVREQLERVAALAGELGLWAVVGGNHRLTPPNRPHNSLYVLSDQGELVGRYDKRRCSHTEIGDWYSPGFTPCVFDVDGFRFGCALCIEVNFPELFLDYAASGVDCVLFSSYSRDPIFEVLAQAHAAASALWISVSVPAQCSAAMPSGVIGPHGYRLGSCTADGAPGLVCVELNRDDPALDVALHKARPWRARARAGDVYEARRVDDPRSGDRTRF
ncbi:carbon-nitrogen hydrolase family protein [Actinoallomurus rhizosphaericola]|uniref:carbon-nitrogen hydrolase family protein n=1 Tax=Actinoallomurus rhizosphaericola TaxID=2952536 RepID=UPI002093CE8D|nr:carbon-nitrogen hydrolase family protein [Actinoallomurus rhizosphaericola]MCO5999358.1 carbon-nitrogen hydrolase family protein [Actinoallomurus rhizosphaericola]